MLIELDRDVSQSPRVRELIEEALARAQPVWVGLTSGAAEPFARQSTYLELADAGCYINSNQLCWGNRSGARIGIDGVLLALRSTGPCFASCGVDNKPLNDGDALLIAVGGIKFYGRLP